MAFSILLAFFYSVDFPDIECLGIKRTKDRRRLRFLCVLIRTLARLRGGLLFSDRPNAMNVLFHCLHISYSDHSVNGVKISSMQLFHLRLSQRLHLDRYHDFG